MQKNEELSMEGAGLPSRAKTKYETVMNKERIKLMEGKKFYDQGIGAEKKMLQPQGADFLKNLTSDESIR
jgi:hypothetical protein